MTNELTQGLSSLSRFGDSLQTVSISKLKFVVSDDLSVVVV